jgi:hypothetical protein
MTGGAFAETQAQHDKRTNYDGYGSAHNRYQNAILMKPHDSILKGGKMEYWNGLDDYHYKEKRSKKRFGQHRGKAWRNR